MQIQKKYLKAEAIVKFFNGDDVLDTEIMCNPSRNLITTDQSLYEALGSFEDKSKIDLNRLVKLLEVVEVVSYTRTFKRPRKILTPQRATELNNLFDKTRTKNQDKLDISKKIMKKDIDKEKVVVDKTDNINPDNAETGNIPVENEESGKKIDKENEKIESDKKNKNINGENNG